MLIYNINICDAHGGIRTVCWRALQTNPWELKERSSYHMLAKLSQTHTHYCTSAMLPTAIPRKLNIIPRDRACSKKHQIAHLHRVLYESRAGFPSIFHSCRAKSERNAPSLPSCFVFLRASQSALTSVNQKIHNRFKLKERFQTQAGRIQKHRGTVRRTGLRRLGGGVRWSWHVWITGTGSPFLHHVNGLWVIIKAANHCLS